jgi:hypothetical protein
MHAPHTAHRLDRPIGSALGELPPSSHDLVSAQLSVDRVLADLLSLFEPKDPPLTVLSAFPKPDKPPEEKGLRPDPAPRLAPQASPEERAALSARVAQMFVRLNVRNRQS